MRTQNKNVPEFWANNKPAKGYGSLHTDGQNLYSYNLKIGFTKNEDQKVLLVRKRSVTTTKHINYARRLANEIVNVDILEKFILELRSGKYYQCKYDYKKYDRNNCFCAAGLLINIACPKFFNKNIKLSTDVFKENDLSHNLISKLFDLNDRADYSFSQIADYIEKEYIFV